MPARSKSTWLGATASAGVSFNVGIRAFDQRTRADLPPGMDSIETVPGGVYHIRGPRRSSRAAPARRPATTGPRGPTGKGGAGRMRVTATTPFTTGTRRVTISEMRPISPRETDDTIDEKWPGSRPHRRGRWRTSGVAVGILASSTEFTVGARSGSPVIDRGAAVDPDRREVFGVPQRSSKPAQGRRARRRTTLAAPERLESRELMAFNPLGFSLPDLTITGSAGSAPPGAARSASSPP